MGDGGEKKSSLPFEEPAFGEAEQPKDLNSPLLVRYMLHFSAPHQRKSPFNSTGLERHSIRTTIPAALISDVFKFQKNDNLTPPQKKT